jgi:prepilin-type N-terminal cleavage/methylation domain-containing protein
MKKSTNGFTIVELIIVIVVIAILAAIVIVAYNGFQARSKATAVEVGLKDIEKSLRVYAADQKWATWPTDSTIDPGKSNPSFQTLITDLPAYKQYIQTAPTTSDLAASAWAYDYDGDVKSSCGSVYNGTNIVITGITQDVVNSLDTSMDDGNNNCGRIRYDAAALKLFYSLSYTNDLTL